MTTMVMLSAQSVAGPAYLVVDVLLGVVLLVVGETGCVEDQMVMNMFLVNMGGPYECAFAAQYFFFWRLQPEFMHAPLVTPPQAQRLGSGGILSVHPCRWCGGGSR